MADVELVQEAIARRDALDLYVGTVGKAYVEEVLPVREAVRGLSNKLHALAGEFGDLRAEARIAWALSLGPLTTVAELAHTASKVDRICVRLRHRCSAQVAGEVLRELRLTADARGDAAAEDALRVVTERLDHRLSSYRERREAPAREAASDALRAVLGLLDLLRARAPEELQ